MAFLGSVLWAGLTRLLSRTAAQLERTPSVNDRTNRIGTPELALLDAFDVGRAVVSVALCAVLAIHAAVGPGVSESRRAVAVKSRWKDA